MRMPIGLPSAAGRRFDVVGFGLNMTDLLVVVERFPRPNSKQPIFCAASSAVDSAVSMVISASSGVS